MVLLVLLVMGVGYAYLTSNLSITGETGMAGNTWNIYFDNLELGIEMNRKVRSLVVANMISSMLLTANEGVLNICKNFIENVRDFLDILVESYQRWGNNSISCWENIY